MAVVLAAGLGLPMRTVSQSGTPDGSPPAGRCDEMANGTDMSPAPTSEPCPGLSSPSATLAPTAIEIEARDLSFTPSTIDAPAGPTTIRLQNAGQVVHNVTFDELGIQIVAIPGAVAEIEAEDLPPGTYQFYCSISGHRLAGMEGTLIVH
jgi:plastocyanin